MYEEVVPGTFFDPIVSAMIRHLIGDTCADWLEVPRSNWDAVAKVAPSLLRVVESVEERSPFGEWGIDRLGHLTTVFQLSVLTRGRVMHYAIPAELKPEFGVPHRRGRWTPPRTTVAP
ncbi:hypothetical protein J2S68_003981 [Glycomyces algeriensis]|uniref:Uncharacterized protein n=1 Tax=Glycomyces algeriensis TaxID=256037 RepID=A0A9W6LJ25_9ACTN|nr:hypothetical protein [Glycomyces algeriensis]MDA1369066.1 hypothetical protein [Glycomyces algeriensis]MDR7352438.1 hypothetical protein [Glycomyces algeriensis]GLI45178.1 hypothetical protein GALLR39Z86_50280 [Glycomyces algeriensis]